MITIPNHTHRQKKFCRKLILSLFRFSPELYYFNYMYYYVLWAWTKRVYKLNTFQSLFHKFWTDQNKFDFVQLFYDNIRNKYSSNRINYSIINHTWCSFFKSTAPAMMRLMNSLHNCYLCVAKRNTQTANNGRIVCIVTHQDPMWDPPIRDANIQGFSDIRNVCMFNHDNNFSLVYKNDWHVFSDQI